jgi:UDP-glucose 4-epimerase
MRILVTGGLGHIGSALIREPRIREIASSIHVIDDLSSERYASLYHLPAGDPVGFRRAPVQDLRASDLDGVDVIVHLAAQTDATASLTQRERVFENNLGATSHVAKLARETSTRFIFASTTSVYGSQSSRVDEECDELVPQSPYAECKLQEEAVIHDLAERGLDATILRLGTIAGPSPGMRFHTAVNKFCLQARLGEPLSVWSTAWNQLRPYLDVGDCAAAIAWSVSAGTHTRPGRARVLNVVTENLSVQQIVAHVEQAFGPVEVHFTDSPIMNQLSYEVSADRIREAGFVPSGTIGVSISQTASWLAGVTG